jgi:hypothetical protein
METPRRVLARAAFFRPAFAEGEVFSLPALPLDCLHDAQGSGASGPVGPLGGWERSRSAPSGDSDRGAPYFCTSILVMV